MTFHTDVSAIYGQIFSSERYNSIRILPWNDPAISANGFDPRSLYVETFWLGTLGPTATWLIRLAAYNLDNHPAGVILDADEIAHRIGVGAGTGRNGALNKTLRRCARFGIARLPCLSPPPTPVSAPPASQPAMQVSAATTPTLASLTISPTQTPPLGSAVQPPEDDGILAVEILRKLPVLPGRYVRQLPDHLKQLHADFIAGKVPESRSSIPHP
ncbi:MAG: hypothetical protein ACYDGY_09010 [Acidimicrobiales bacterium]